MERVRWGDGAQHCRCPTLHDRSHGNAISYVGNKRLDSARMGCSEQVRESHTLELSLKPNNGSSKQASATALRKLIAKEMPKETDNRRHSPSVIAKLMGLDSLPAQHSKHGQKMKVTDNSQEKYLEKNSCRNNYVDKDPQGFKDIYEVSEIANFNGYNNQLVQKTNTSSTLEVEKPSSRKKLMKAKCISTDQNRHRFIDYLDAPEILDSNKERFEKIFQEPDSLFMKHLHDLQNSSPPNRSTVVKPSKNSKQKRSTISCTSGKENGEDTTLKKHACPSHRYLDLLMEGNHENCTLPTTIVVLKPSLEIVQDSAKAIPFLRSKEGYYSSYRKHRELRRSGSRDLFPELKGRHRLPHVVNLSRNSPRSSKDIAKLVTKKMRQGAENGLASDKSPTVKRGAIRHENSHASCKRDLVDWDGSSSSSCSSSESYLSKVARRHLSDRWKTIQNIQESRSSSKNSLSEVLAQSDRESSTDGQDTFDTKLVGLGPLGISSRDGWKDVFPSSLSRSRSLPASSSVYGYPESSMKLRACNKYSSSKKMIRDVSSKSWRENYTDDSGPSSLRSKKLINRHSHSTTSLESDFSIDDLHINFDEIRNNSKLMDPCEENKLCTNLSLTGFSDEDECPIDVAKCEDKTSLTEQSQFAESATFDGHYSGETDSSVDEVHKSDCYATDSDQTRATSKEAEQPSPISVLEPPFEDETSSSCCFERVSADLSELRTQLQLLKLESREAILSSEEETVKTGESSKIRGGMPSRIEQNMELAFLYAMLYTSGLDATDQEMLFATCCSLEFPVHPSVFKQLEEMYVEQPNWSTLERKLLFDRINFALAEIVGEWMDERPWAKAMACIPPLGLNTQALVKEVCKVLAAQVDGNRKRPERDLVKDTRWMETTEDVDRVGKELESFLIETLLEELVSEFAQ